MSLKVANAALVAGLLLSTAYTARGDCEDGGTHFNYWSEVLRTATNQVYGEAYTQVTGDYWFEWENQVSAVEKVGSTTINSGGNSAGEGVNNTGGRLIEGSATDLNWYSAPSTYGAGTYTISSVHDWYNPEFVCSYGYEIPYSGDVQQSLAVDKPTVYGLSGVWWLGGGDDSANGYYNQGLLQAHTNCGPGDTCTDTPSWSITDGSDKVSLSCNSCASTTTTALAASSGLGDITIQLSIGGFQADPFPYTINAPSYMTSVYPYVLDTNYGSGFWSYVYWANVDILGDEMNSIALNEQFGTFTHDQPTSWADPVAGGIDGYPGYTWADNVYLDCAACMPATAHPSGPPPTGSAVEHGSQTWFIGSKTGSVGVCVQVDTLQLYTDHGRDNSPSPRCS